MFGLDQAATQLVKSTVGQVVDKALAFIPDPVQRAQFEKDMRQMDINELQQQVTINLAEAQSEKWWKAGWRPFVGWTCGIAFAYHFVIQAFLTFIVRLWIPDFTPPTLDMTELFSVLCGILGLSYHRSKDKQGIK